MDIQCTDCGTPYRLPGERISSTGVRIGCRKCGRKLKVRKAPDGSGLCTPDDFRSRDLSEVGLAFQVRCVDKSHRAFRYFGQFEELIASGEVRLADSVSWDKISWHPIREMGDREMWFWDKYERARKGELGGWPQMPAGEGEDPENAPTAVFIFRPPGGEES